MNEEKKRRRRKPILEEVQSVERVEIEAPEEIEEEDDDGGGGFVVKRVPWILRVDGLDVDIPLTGIKLPTFTTGMIDRGDVTIELVNLPEIALNGYFRSWLMKPLPRRLKLQVVDVVGKPIETWGMTAVPGAMGFAELDVQDDAPWVTQVAFSVTEIKIEPAKSS